MSTITINGKTLTLSAHILYAIADAARNDLEPLADNSAEIGRVHDEAERLENFIIDVLNNPPTHYHVEGHSRQGHYVTTDEWYANKPGVETLCGKIYKHVTRVDMPPGGDAPTPSKPLCPKCKEIHDAIEGWDA